MSVGTYLDCDGCSVAPFAAGDRGDFRRRLRTEAAQNGWVRRLVNGRMVDLCPDCASRHSSPTGRGERDT